MKTLQELKKAFNESLYAYDVALDNEIEEAILDRDNAYIAYENALKEFSTNKKWNKKRIIYGKNK